VEPDDADIVRASLARPDRFETIFGRHHRRIWTYLARRNGREAADELAGEVFVSAFAHRDRFDPARGSVVGWLYGIAANLTRTRFRREARAYQALGRVAAHDVPEAPAVDEAVDALAHGQDLARVQEAMDALPDRDRELIVLVAWEGLTYAEVAQVVGVEIGTVRSRLSRARQRLRELAALDDQVSDDSRPQRRKVTDVTNG
jgi:RNA polymerase sigma factor (sigma-70 family)